MSNPLERVKAAASIQEAKEIILEDLTDIVVKEMDINPSDVNMDKSLTEDLDYDSLQIYELVIDLEEAYDIQLPDEQLDAIETVEELVDLIYSLIK